MQMLLVLVKALPTIVSALETIFGTLNKLQVPTADAHGNTLLTDFESRLAQLEQMIAAHKATQDTGTQSGNV